MAYVNEKQHEAAEGMEAQPQGAPAPSRARVPKNVSFADAEKLVAKDRGQHAPMPPMKGSAKGTARDALAFFTGGFHNA